MALVVELAQAGTVTARTTGKGVPPGATSRVRSCGGFFSPHGDDVRRDFALNELLDIFASTVPTAVGSLSIADRRQRVSERLMDRPLALGSQSLLFEVPAARAFALSRFTFS